MIFWSYVGILKKFHTSHNIPLSIRNLENWIAWLAAPLLSIARATKSFPRILYPKSQT